MRQLRLYKFINFLLFVFFSLGVPIILITEEYQLYITDARFYVLVVGLLVLYITAKFFWNYLKRSISYMDPGYYRSLCEEFVRILPLFILWGMLVVMERHVSNAVFIVKWSAISNIIGAVFSVNYIRLKIKLKEMRG